MVTTGPISSVYHGTDGIVGRGDQRISRLEESMGRVERLD
jgi:hypothetical protein